LLALKLDAQTSLDLIVAANPEEAAILELLQQGVTDSNELQSGSRLTPELFNQTLTMLEITCKIHPLGASHWSIN
jgi:hypothetical protein